MRCMRFCLARSELNFGVSQRYSRIMSNPPSRIPSQYEQVRTGVRAGRAADTPAPRAAMRSAVRGSLAWAAWALVDIAIHDGPHALLALSPLRYLALAGLTVLFGGVAAAGALALRGLRRRGFLL